MPSMYNVHNPICREVSQSSKHGLATNIAFTLSSIQERTFLLPKYMQDYALYGWEAPHFKRINKYKGASYVRDNIDDLWKSFNDILDSGKDIKVKCVLLFSTIPMISTVKAGFITQLAVGKVGCLDSHNLTRYGIDPKRFHINDNLGLDTKTRKVRDYTQTCDSLGGSRVLWNKWCPHIAKTYPNHFNNGFEVSKLHADCFAYIHAPMH